MAKMSDKTKRAINTGRRKAGLKPIRFGAKKKKKSGGLASESSILKGIAMGHDVYGARKGHLSEDGYAKRLQKELGKEALVFRAGDMSRSGVPDIVAFYRGRPSFYEVKSIGDLLKKSQEKWIKKNCLEKRRKACVVFYRQTPAGHFKYLPIILRKKYLKKYCLSSPKPRQAKTERELRSKSSRFT